MTLYELYDVADKNNIQVLHYPLGSLESISMPDVIGIDCGRMKTETDEKTHLAHEMGHCLTYSFYNSATYETRSRMEARANRWAYQTLVPLPELISALSAGILELWELAEYFDVDERFMRAAVDFYKGQNVLNEAG